MSEVRIRLVRGWLSKSDNDLQTARKLAAPPDPILDTAIYHCQQSAEKALKGFLLFNHVDVLRTHDARALVTLAAQIQPGFSQWLTAAETLSPYATAFRYPVEMDAGAPAQEEFEQALRDAEGICQYVISLLAGEL